MFKKYVGVASYAHEIIVMTENDGGNAYVIEALRSGKMFGTNDVKIALEKYEEFCNAQEVVEHNLLFNS